MEIQRQEVLNRLSYLNSLKYPTYSKMQMRSKRPLMHRVERQNLKSYKDKVKKQKVFFNEKLKEIDNYLSLPSVGDLGIMSVPAPIVIMKPLPSLKKTKNVRFKTRLKR